MDKVSLIQGAYNICMSTIKQHCMLKLKKGEHHPIFSLDYLPENIASLIEASFLATEYLLLVFFLVNFFIDIFSKYSMNFVPTLMVNGFANEFFKRISLTNTQGSNFIAFISTVLLYVITYRYFEFVKYNLHPKRVSARRHQPASEPNRPKKPQPLASRDFQLDRKWLSHR